MNQANIAPNYTVLAEVNGFRVAQAKNKMHYIFDACGNLYKGSIFTRLEDAVKCAEGLDGRERFIATFHSK